MITRIAGQAGGATGALSSNVSKAFASNVTAGNRIVVFGMRGTPGTGSKPFVAGDCTKIAGTATLGPITLDASLEAIPGTSHLQAGIWSALVTGTGSCTMQLACPAGLNDGCDIGINEYTSNLGTISLQDAKTGSGATGAPATASGTSTEGAVFCAALATETGAATTHTPGSTYTQVYEEENGAAFQTGSAEDKIVTTPTTSTADWIAPTTVPWVAALAIYQEPVAVSYRATLGTTFNTTTGSHTVTATPAVGDLIVIFCANTGLTTNPTVSDNNSDGLGAYTQINGALKNTSADKCFIYVRNALVGSASSTVFTVTGASSTGGGLQVIALANADKVGAQAWVQTQKQENQAATGTPAPVFSTTPSSTNLILGFLFNGTNPATTAPRTGYFETGDVGYNTPATGAEFMERDAGESSATITWGGTSASAFADIVVEMSPKTGANPKSIRVIRQAVNRAAVW